jgi:transketolase
MAEPKLNVNIVCALPGLTTGYGPSHQATEDIAMLRGMPGLTIVDPCDAVDIEQAVPQLAACEGPTYMRLLRGLVPRILDDYDYRFELGKAKVVRPGQDVVFVSSGLMTMRGLLAAEELGRQGVDVCVVHVPTLKPFDTETVVSQIDTDRMAFTLENHTIVGGLYESVASALIQRGIGRKVRAIGLPDAFLDAGALNTLHDRYGLSKQAVVERVLSELTAIAPSRATPY